MNGTRQAETFFSEAEKDAIANAIAQVEKSTAGEIAVMVVDESDSYPEACLVAANLLGGLVALLLADLVFGGSLHIFLACMLVLGGIFLFLAQKLPVLKKAFILPSRLDDRVRDRAVRAFYEKKLYLTRDESGVLFFLSLFEHKVWVLADQGIYRKISQETLQQYASRVAAGIRAGQAAEVLCEEIRAVGVILTENFPVRHDDANELSDKVIIG